MAAAGRSTPRTAWHRYKRLPVVERRLVGRAVGHLAVVALQRRSPGGVRYARDRADRLETPTGAAPHPTPERAAQLIDRVARIVPWRVTCLDRSLALARVLRRTGVSPQLCLGVRRTDGELEFHAWLEIDGRVVNDDLETVSSYSRFAGALPRSANLG
jgi:hypothetical protein